MVRRHSYSHGLIDWAFVLIVAAWIGLWFLWPPMSAWSIRSKPMPEPRVVFLPRVTGEVGHDYAVSLMLVARPNEQQEDATSPMGNLLRQPPRLPRYLERSAGADGLGAGALPAPQAASPEMGEYRPVWSDEPVFPLAPASRDMRVLVEVSGDLRTRGFDVPVFTEEDMKQFDKPWQVVVYVDVNEFGRPAHVLLQTGCEDARINATVVRALYRGMVPTPGGPCGGRVVVSYGKP